VGRRRRQRARKLKRLRPRNDTAASYGEKLGGVRYAIILKGLASSLDILLHEE
jgi:hypothetical protein